MPIIKCFSHIDWLTIPGVCIYKVSFYNLTKVILHCICKISPLFFNIIYLKLYLQKVGAASLYRP